MVRARTRVVCGVALAFVLFAAAAEAVVIDDFEAGAFDVVAVNIEPQTDPTGTHIIGTQREVGAVAGRATLDLTGGGDHAAVFEGGLGVWWPPLQVGLNYQPPNDGDLDANLTAGGHDRFLVTVSSLTAALASVEIQVYTTGSGEGALMKDITSAGVHAFPYGEFTPTSGSFSFGDVDQIIVIVGAYGLGETHRISDIRTAGPTDVIPEPAELGLVGLALLGFKRRRR